MGAHTAVITPTLIIYTLIFHALSHASISVYCYNHLIIAVTVLVPFGHLIKAETVQLLMTSLLYKLYFS